MSSKGQIVIPKAIREKLGIGPGSVLKIYVRGKKIILEPSPPPPDIFVELGDESGEILKETRRTDEARIQRLLRDLDVESSS
ncbi:MAG: AbrB/MazE/SpoVT family DNA-binding domain-containing protein [Candidatus Thorarchaeota archaeon]